MLNTLNDTAPKLPPPLTHSSYIAAWAIQRQGAARQSPPHVQIRKRFAGRPEVLCGQVTRLANGDGGKELFEVATAIGSVYVVPENIRLCSGDGRCTCEPDPPQPGAEESQNNQGENPATTRVSSRLTKASATVDQPTTMQTNCEPT